MTLIEWLISAVAFMAAGVIVGAILSVIGLRLFLKLIAEPVDDLPGDFPDEPWPGAANDPEPDYPPAA